MFGGSAKEVLEQPASRTFAMIKAGRKLQKEKEAMFLCDLIDVAAVPGQKVKYAQTLRGNFMKRFGAERKKALSVGDPMLGIALKSIFNIGERAHGKRH